MWCFELLHDWRFIDFETGHLADCEQFKIGPMPYELGQDVAKNNPNSLPLTKKFKNYPQDLAQFFQELGSPINK